MTAWTRADLPISGQVLGETTTPDRYQTCMDTIDCAVAHLNDHYPKRHADVLTREDVDRTVRDAGGGFFDQRLDAITDAVWNMIQPDPADALAAELEQAARNAIQSSVNLVSTTFGVPILDVDELLAEVDWREIARAHLGES